MTEPLTTLDVAALALALHAHDPLGTHPNRMCGMKCAEEVAAAYTAAKAGNLPLTPSHNVVHSAQPAPTRLDPG